MTILFVCRQNACRSQIAAGWARHFAAEHGLDATVLSAGSEPAREVNPTAIKVMAEVGIDISREAPVLLTEELAARADFIVAVCGEDACPFIPGATYWGVADPAGQPIEVFRMTREIIGERTASLIDRLPG